jgi:hypothetical protein
MQPTPAQGPTTKNPFQGLYNFVKDHLMYVNNVILVATTLVGFLDFLVPKTPNLSRTVYACTTLLVVLMLISAFAPAFFAKAMHVVGMTANRADMVPLWKRPLWLCVVALLIGVSVIGAASIAKANQGGLVASNFPEVRQLQNSILALQADTTAIRQGVDSANGKLDILVANSQDPQKDVVARGYAYDSAGLSRAIEQGDRTAVGLFVKAGLKVDRIYPINRIVAGQQQWDPAIALLLKPEMFRHPLACDQNPSWAKEPFEERVLEFKRLCGAETSIAKFEPQIRRLEAINPRDEYREKELAQYKRALAVLKH